MQAVPAFVTSPQRSTPSAWMSLPAAMRYATTGCTPKSLQYASNSCLKLP